MDPGDRTVPTLVGLAMATAVLMAVVIALMATADGDSTAITGGSTGNPTSPDRSDDRSDPVGDATIDSTGMPGATETSVTVGPRGSADGSNRTSSAPPTSSADGDGGERSSTTAISAGTGDPLQGLVRQVLGPLPQGGGQLVRMVAPDDEGACPRGTLVVERDGRVSHTYPGSYGPLTLDPGPYAQAALLERCEESIGRLFFASTAVTAPGQAPQWQGYPVPDGVVRLDRPGWLGLTGFFAADAVFADGGVSWVETVVFDAFDGSMWQWSDKLGHRDNHELLGIDFVVPNGWNHAPIDETSSTVSSVSSVVSMWDLESASFVNIEVIDVLSGPAPVPGPLPGEKVIGSSAVAVELWADRGDGRAAVADIVQAVDHRFAGPDGARTVRVIAVDQRTVVVESHLAAGTGTAGGEVPAMAVDAIRVFDTVG